MSSNAELIQFLQQELAVSPAAIAMLQRHPEQDQAPLQIILWQYGLITLQQLSQVFDWLEARC